MSTVEAAVGARTDAALQKRVARSAALLLFLGLLTGGYAAGAMTGVFPVDAHSALAAHLGAMFGSFMLFGYAWSLPMLRYTGARKLLLAQALVVSTYANWLVTAVKASVHVAGVGVTDSPVNNIVFGVLNVFVVLPVLIASGAWAFGFGRD